MDGILALALALKKSKKYTDDIAKTLAGGLRYKGSVADKNALPLGPTEGLPEGNKLGDMYTTNDDGHEHVWTKDASSGTINDWLDLSKDLENYYKKVEVDTLLSNLKTELNTTIETTNTLTKTWAEETFIKEHQDISGKLNVLPKVDDPSDPGFGWEYHIPYRFDVSLDTEKANVDLHTLTLDNKVTKMTFNKQIPSATTATAGLMSAADKERVDKSLNILPKVDDPSDPGFGWEYHIPYNFDAVPDTEKLNITLKTITLDNKVTKMNFDKSLPSATTTTAGLMSAADKAALENKQDALTAGRNITIEDNVISAADGLPEGTAAGEAIIFDGEEWKTQEGYGFIKYEVAETFTWDGTTSEAKIDTSLGEMHKIANPSILPTLDNVAPTKCTYLDGGDEYTVKWKDATLYMMGTKTLFGRCGDLFMVVVYQDGTRISFFDEKEFSKGIWFNKQNTNTYITSIESANPTTVKIDSKFIPQDPTKANDNEVVKLTGYQIISGNKLFNAPLSYAIGEDTTILGYKKISTFHGLDQTTNYLLPTTSEENVTLASEKYVDEKLVSAEKVFIPNDITTTAKVGNLEAGRTFGANTSLWTILTEILVGKETSEAHFYYGTAKELPTSVSGLSEQGVTRLDIILNGITKTFTTADLYLVFAISKSANVDVNVIETTTLNADLECVIGYGGDEEGHGYAHPYETPDAYMYVLPKSNGTYTYNIKFVAK